MQLHRFYQKLDTLLDFVKFWRRPSWIAIIYRHKTKCNATIAFLTCENLGIGTKETHHGITDRLLHLLDRIQHSAARIIIMCIKRHDRQSMTAVLRHLHLATRERSLPAKSHINYKIVVLVFRALHGLAPA